MMSDRIAELVWLGGMIAWYVIRNPFQRRARKTSVRKSLFDWRERFTLVIAYLGLFVIPVVYAATGFPRSFDHPFSPALAWPGVVSLGAALWLFRRSHVDLGQNWSISLEVREQHTIVKTGVYRVIRHPMYASFFLLSVAQMALLPNWLVAASGLLAALAFYAFRLPREEQMMLECFGDDYRRYMAETKRFIPWIL
jgi:protein-S-isoprenylcysteine O-methyltransferase Ste14